MTEVAALEEIVATADRRLSSSDADPDFKDAAYVTYCSTKGNALSELALLSSEDGSETDPSQYLAGAIDAYDRALERCKSSQDASIEQYFQLEVALRASRFHRDIVGDEIRAKSIAEKAYEQCRAGSVSYPDRVLRLLEALRADFTAPLPPAIEEPRAVQFASSTQDA